LVPSFSSAIASKSSSSSRIVSVCGNRQLFHPNDALLPLRCPRPFEATEYQAVHQKFFEGKGLWTCDSSLAQNLFGSKFFSNYIIICFGVTSTFSISSRIWRLSKLLGAKSHFRGDQERALHLVLQKAADVLVVAGMGVGKSLIFQLIPRIRKCITVVVAPLIGLRLQMIKPCEKLGLKVTTL